MINRRQFVAASALGAALGRARPVRSQAPDRGMVTCDAHQLRRVLVHEPGPETRKVMTLAGVDHPLRADELLGPEAPAQHREFAARLRASGAEVLRLRDLLPDALEAARQADGLRPWLESALPQLVGREEDIDAEALLGASDAFVYHTEPGTRKVRPLTEPLRFLMYVRDLAVMTPRGLVLGHFGRLQREFEPELLRFLLAWSPELGGYPIAFDAREEGVYLQGGDVIVADERTLLVGVGNLTEEAAARRLSRRLEMDVVAVQLPSDARFKGAAPQAGGNGLRVQFLHLDSIVSLTGPRSAVVVPYFLEAACSGKDPLSDLLAGLAEHPGVDADFMNRLAETLAGVGTVRIYRAGSGEPLPLRRRPKLVDYLRHRRYEIAYVGGVPPGEAEAKHVIEHVLYELRFQAANVVATSPGRVLAVAGNDRTIEGLRAGRVEVETFPASELVRWHGGPHCLTLPLEREPA